MISPPPASRPPMPALSEEYPQGETCDLCGDSFPEVDPETGFCDGWQTHYTLGSNELPVRGWRRRYVSDAGVDTTRVIAGYEDNGYYEISYWPEGWDRWRNWLETGYMRLVPDPLDPFAAGDPA